jgi:molybdopterin molybdotransferase
MAIPENDSIQRLSRLTPLGDILALIEARAGAVAPRDSELAPALGTLAEDVVVPQLPPHPIALRDGFAVEAAALADAGPYAPAPLASMPLQVAAGEPLPGGTDAITPLDAVVLRGRRAEAIAPIVPGEDILPAGGDAMPQTPLRRAGERLRSIDAAAMQAAGVQRVMIRSPRIRIVHGGAAGSSSIDAAIDFLLGAVARCGGTALQSRHDQAKRLDDALTDGDADAVIAVGGTGSGRRDSAVKTLARLGRVEAHGVAISPGETAAFGFAGATPVVLVPGRLDAALAVWLLLGRQLVAKLAGGSVTDAVAMLPLKRKVTSAIGLAALIPVGCTGGVAEPLAAGYLSLTSLTRSDGWIVIPADSEGFAAGTPVAVKPWP